jgi:hypothetical protein
VAITDLVVNAFIKENAERPPIDFCAVTFALIHFRCEISEGA